MYKEELRQTMVQVAQNPNAQAAGATFTTTSGMLTYLGWLPPVLGVLATVMGMILTWFMISKVRLDKKKSKLEIKIMKKELVCDDCIENRRKYEP